MLFVAADMSCDVFGALIIEKPSIDCSFQVSVVDYFLALVFRRMATHVCFVLCFLGIIPAMHTVAG